jgi:acyl-CoA synthetase (AMP-forming)/AMP-acid ligase II
MRRGLPPVSDRTLLAAYQRVLARTPDAEAQADEAGPVTFAGSYERSLRLAAGFAAAGIGPRQPAALLLDNSLDAAHVWSGLGLGGMVEVPVNTAYKGRFLSHVLNDSGAGLIVIDDGYADRPHRRVVPVRTTRLTSPGSAASRQFPGGKSIRSTDPPRPTRTVATICSGNRPCATTPGVDDSWTASAAGSCTGPW